jgi:hypothetical protein
MLVSFRACASGGGFSLEYLLGELGYARPGDIAWTLGGVGLTLSRKRRGVADPISAAALVCLPTTLLILSSRGTHVNQLLDASAIGALAIGAALGDRTLRHEWAWFLLPIATCLGIAEAIFLGGEHLKHSELGRATAALPRGVAPVLSEQPWIPLLAGERPYLLDGYSLLQTRRQSAEVDSDFLARLDQCGFRAVVLLGRPEKSEFWYETMQFGPGFKKHLLATYAFAGVVGGHAIYLPMCTPSTPAGLPAPRDSETILDRMQKPSLLHRLLDRVRARRH